MRGELNTTLVPQPRLWAGQGRLRRGLTWLGLALTVGFVYLSVRGLDIHATWRATVTATPLWFVPTAAALVLAVLLRAARWRYMFARSARPGFGPILSAYLVGQFFNNVLPFRAGEAARILALVRRTKGSAAEATATVVLERVLDVLSLVVVVLACAPWLPQIAWLKPVAVVAVSVVFVVVVAAWLLARFDDRPIVFLLAPLRALPGFDGVRVAAAARAAFDGLGALRSVSTALACCLLTLASWFALSLSFWLLTFAFHLHVPFLAGVLVVVTTNLGQVIPSSAAGIGVFEAAALLALASYGVGRPAGLPYAVGLHALNLVPYLLIGAIALRRTPVTRREMKHGWSSPYGRS